MMVDAYRQLESRAIDGPGRFGRRSGGRSSPQSPAFVGVVFAQTHVPTATGCYFAVHPATVLGAEAEGGTGSLAVDTSSTILVCVVGGRAPIVGDAMICRFVGSRWVAERLCQAGGGNIRIPSCYCSAIPSILTMSSSNTASDGGMFQNCSLAYGNTPPQYGALSLGNQCFLSTTSFTDSNGEVFRYAFNCLSATFNLSRVYAQSVFGSPFQDLVRYSWSLGYPGNTCTPFLLSSGRVYTGGNAQCVVTVSS